MRKSFKKVAASALAAVMALTVVVSVGNTASAAKASFDPAGTYHAYVGFQQSGSWRFHDECTSETTGLNGTDIKEAGFNYETDVFRSGDNGLEKIDGVVEGAELKGNGTYTVKISDLNDSLTSVPDGCTDELKMAMVYLSTDMPADAKDKVQFSDVSLKVDGKTVTLPSTQFFKPETLELGYTSLYLIDTYAKDQGEYADSPELAVAPSDSIEITFTISGFTNDNPDAVAETPTPAPTKAADTSNDSDEGGVNGGLVAGIVVAVVVVVGVVVVVVRKKK